MKKLKHLSFLIFIIILQSCASLPAAKYGSYVSPVQNPTNTEVEYLSHDYLVKETKKKSEVEMWTDSKFSEEQSYLPKGGLIKIQITASTIGHANTEYWSYIIQDMEGNEIIRQHGEDNIPNHTTSSYGTTWWNIDVVYLKDELSGPIKLFVIDELMSKRSEFIIYPNQTSATVN